MAIIVLNLELTAFKNRDLMTHGHTPTEARLLLLVVAAAMTDSQGRVLLAQRPEGKSLAGLWEFPGGKLEPGESPEVALRRELREELDIEVEPQDMWPLSFASYGYEHFHLMMPLYQVRRWQGEPKAMEAAGLAWVKPSEMDGYAMPPADKPLVSALQAWERWS
jgi:8-oxo-dGTP diphosphatase